MTEPAAFITEGALLQTRSGLKARVICTDRKDSVAPVLALVTGIHGNEAIFSYLPNGWRWKGGESDEDLIETPPAVARVPSIADRLMQWHKLWRLDGDLCRCQECGRGINAAYFDKALMHSSECSHRGSGDRPWREIEDILSGGREVLPVGEVKLPDDKLRLDWMEREGHDLVWDDDRPGVTRASDGIDFYGDTLRAAIDAAIADEHGTALAEPAPEPGEGERFRYFTLDGFIYRHERGCIVQRKLARPDDTVWIEVGAVTLSWLEATCTETAAEGLPVKPNP